MSETKNPLSLNDLDNLVNHASVTAFVHSQKLEANTRLTGKGKPFIRRRIVKKVSYELVAWHYDGTGQRKLKVLKVYRRKPKGVKA